MLGERIEQCQDPLEIVRLGALIRRRPLERCGDSVATFREGAAGDPEVAATYEEGRSGWSPDEYEEWLSDRMSEMLL